MGHDCKKMVKEQNESLSKCKKDFISQFSIANKVSNKDYAQISDLLNIVTSVTIMALLIYFRKDQKDIDIQCDIKEITPSDYTILVMNLPSEIKKNEI